MADAPGLFSDASGTPIFAPCAVLFLDLLGTAGERDPARMLDRLRRTKRAVDEARRLSPNDASDSGLWQMTWFSDNLGLHYAITEPIAASQAVGFLVTDVGWLQLALMQEGLIARGAVAVGDYYADAEFIQGPALEAAASPRVVLDDIGQRAHSVHAVDEPLSARCSAGAKSPLSATAWESGTRIVNVANRAHPFRSSAAWRLVLSGSAKVLPRFFIKNGSVTPPLGKMNRGSSRSASVAPSLIQASVFSGTTTKSPGTSPRPYSCS
jgi:hypothetical protein